MGSGNTKPKAGDSQLSSSKAVWVGSKGVGDVSDTPADESNLVRVGPYEVTLKPQRARNASNKTKMGYLAPITGLRVYVCNQDSDDKFERVLTCKEVSIINRKNV